jgi:hypothetical protein
LKVAPDPQEISVPNRKRPSQLSDVVKRENRLVIAVAKILSEFVCGNRLAAFGLKFAVSNWLILNPLQVIRGKLLFSIEMEVFTVTNLPTNDWSEPRQPESLITDSIDFSPLYI